MLHVLDGSALLVEVPKLGVSSVSGLDHHVSSNDVKIFARCKSRDDVEWSFNNQVESLVEFTFLGFRFPIAFIDDVPLLVGLVVESIPSNPSVLFVLVSGNIEHFVVSFCNNITWARSVLPHLEPSGVGWLHIDPSAMTTD